MERRIIADTSGIIALLNRDDQYHAAVVEIIKVREVLVPVTVLPEVDYLATKYLGERVARTFLEDLVNGEYTYLHTNLEDLARTTQIMERYRDLPLGMVDASIFALAERHRLRQILTLDRRHFNLLRSDLLNYLELFPTA